MAARGRLRQAFWGKRVELLGVGPRPLPREKLTASALATSIRVAVTDIAVRCNAKELGEKICAENGIASAIKLIDKYV